MAILLEQGVFENIGDEFVLELLPINSVLSFDSFTDIINGQLVNRFFTKEFSYSKNGGLFTPFVPLTNVALQGIVAISADQFIFRFKYTRAGALAIGTLNWVCFELDGVTVEPCVIMKINKVEYNALYGSDDKFDEIQSAIVKFNAFAIPKFNKALFLVIDPTIPDITINFEFDETCADLNDLVKTEWGKEMIDTFFGERIDLFDGVRS